jgi:hypothetical protein
MRTRITLEGHGTSGNRSSWYKKVNGVDVEKSNGYALDGDFLNARQEYDLEVGSIIVECRPGGSVKHQEKTGYIYVVGKDGVEEIDGSWDWKNEFLSFRDRVCELLNAEKDENELEDFIDEKLIEELIRRGYQVSK